MALSDSLTLDDASGADVAYVLLGRDETTSRRLNTASTASEPNVLAIKHSVAGKNSSTVDRHLVQFSWTKLDSAGNPKTAVVNFTMAIPRASVITTAMITSMVSNLVDLISDGGFTESGLAGTTVITAINRGET